MILSMIFNFVLVLIWRYDFGRPVLEPTAAAEWTAPLNDLAGKDAGGNTRPRPRPRSCADAEESRRRSPNGSIV
mgnify:CR=1 FL=1